MENEKQLIDVKIPKQFKSELSRADWIYRRLLRARENGSSLTFAGLLELTEGVTVMENLSGGKIKLSKNFAGK